MVRMVLQICIILGNTENTLVMNFSTNRSNRYVIVSFSQLKTVEMVIVMAHPPQISLLQNPHTPTGSTGWWWNICELVKNHTMVEKIRHRNGTNEIIIGHIHICFPMQFPHIYSIHAHVCWANQHLCMCHGQNMACGLGSHIPILIVATEIPIHSWWASPIWANNSSFDHGMISSIHIETLLIKGNR